MHTKVYNFAGTIINVLDNPASTNTPAYQKKKKNEKQLGIDMIKIFHFVSHDHLKKDLRIKIERASVQNITC